MSKRRKQSDSGVTGCVVIDKPVGMTSHDVVDHLRRLLGTRKIGHAGTLDPDATGVLVLGVGRGTKLLQFVTGADKRYDGTIAFGTTTSTLDAAGEVTGSYEMQLEPSEVAAAASRFVGDIDQIPPMVSAVKIGGKRLHELAREGKEVERAPRPVTVHSFRTEPTDDPSVYRASVHCSSGTYIRTLAADLGEALGGGAHLASLRRTAVGSFTLDDCSQLDDPELRPMTEMLRDMPKLQVDATVASQVRVGRPLGPSGGRGRFLITDQVGEPLAIYEVRDGEMRPVKVLVG